MIEDGAGLGERTACVLSQVDQIVRRTLDPKTFGALVQAQMQNEARLMLVHQVRPVRRHLCPFGGKHLGMKMAAETGGAVPPRKRLHKPGRGILGGAGKWAESSKEEARASH